MTDVRCPMCSKSNPADLEVCQYCQARLKPFFGGSSPLEEGSIPEETSSERPSGAQDKGSLEDWLQFMRENEGADQAKKESSLYESIPPFDLSDAGEQDWLSSLRADNEILEGDEEPDEGEPEPDWELTNEPADSDDPDWLKGLRLGGEAGDEPAEADTEGGEVEPDEGEPEWLQRVRSRQEADEEMQAQPDEERPPELAEQEEDELPEWLKGAEDETVSRAPTDAESIPGWMSDLVSDERQTTEIPGVDSASQDVPDWLAKLTTSAEAQETESPVDKDPAAKEPDWLKSPTEFEAHGLFDQEDSLSDQPEEGEPERVSPFKGNLPEWLAESGPPDGAEQPADEGDEELSPGELPGWLEAIRPEDEREVADVSRVDRSVPTESSGPLAGLRGVLPAEPEISLSRKAPSYVIKLQVSDSQQSHADLLSELIQAEGQTAPVPERQVIYSQAILRWLIFVILFLAVLWPIYNASQETALPDYGLEIFDTSTYINQLPGGAPVLLAVDYEPGLSGEMEAVAAAVIDHLMLKGAYLTLVSTLPTGPAQAERLVQSNNARAGHLYKDINQYANLGYIPGGPTGLLSFAQSPRLVLPFALDTDSTFVWERAPLAEVRELSDFNLALVITDNPDRARTWIEQVRGALDGTPLIMLVSAQAEPLVRPYYEGQPRQVQGMVVGVAGGASYERLLERFNLARKYWDAYSYSMSAAVVIVLVGGLGNALLALLANRRQSRGARGS